MTRFRGSKWHVIFWTSVSLFSATQFNACSKVDFARSPASIQEEMQSTASININMGAQYTQNQMVDVQLESLSADEVYVTNDSTCNGGGVWEPLIPTKNGWSLGQKNKSTHVYAKFRNTVKSLSTDCVSDSIIHDDLPPAVILQNPSFATNVVLPEFFFTSGDNISGVSGSTCKWPGKAAEACAASSSNGNIAEGRFLVDVVATDNAGNVSSPYVQDIIVDRTKPVVTLLTVPPAISSTTAASVTFNAVDDRSGIRSIECSWENDTSFGPCTSPAAKTVTEGAHKFYVRATDVAGNVSDVQSHMFTVDLTAPTVTITKAPDDYSNSTSATFEFYGKDGTVDITQFECKIDGLAYATCSSPKTYTGLTQGVHKFEVRGRDTANLWSQPDSHSWWVDTAAPTITWDLTPPAIGKNTTVTFKYTISDGTGSGIAKTECSMDGAAMQACAMDTHTVASLAEGAHTFVVKATDKAGNSSSKSHPFIIDTTVPTLSFTQVPPPIHNLAAFEFKFLATDNRGIDRVECQLDTGAYGACNTQTKHNVTGLSEGAHRFAVRAVDTAGNTSAEIAHYWSVDTIKPVITYVVEPATVIQESGTITLKFTVSDVGSGMKSTVCKLNNVVTACASGDDKSFPGLTPGNYSFLIEATDKAENLTTELRQWVVKPDATQTFPVATQEAIDKVDILFVVDESSSMKTIIENVRKGFKSVGSASYPVNTRIAVTNTAPAWVKNKVTREFDPTKPFYTTSTAAYISKQPGFMKLVNKTSIASWKALNQPEAEPMPLDGCTKTWFAPNETEAGVNCLDAATQVGLLGIGVEAGTVSLSQLNEVVTNGGTSGRLFRADALANVIFVSDTHDAGEKYYKKDGYNNQNSKNGLGALDEMIPYATLRDRIHQTNPGLAGLRFNGIVPLPTKNDTALLKDLRYVPPLPTKSQIGTELLWGFSYLPYIRESGGVAMHADSADWSGAIAKMVSDLSKLINPVVELASPAAAILEVKVDGVILPASQYTLRADKKFLEIKGQSSWPANVTVVVKYSPM